MKFKKLQEEKQPNERRMRSTLQFPELLKMDVGDKFAYKLERTASLRACAAYLRKAYGLQFKTVTYVGDKLIEISRVEGEKNEN